MCGNTFNEKKQGQILFYSKLSLEKTPAEGKERHHRQRSAYQKSSASPPTEKFQAGEVRRDPYRFGEKAGKKKAVKGGKSSGGGVGWYCRLRIAARSTWEVKAEFRRDLMRSTSIEK